MNIVLTGMPGSGKTTVSEVFKRRGKKVFDTDAEIVKKHGVIKDIFALYGEEYFRDLETETVKELAKSDGVVISTGGGCILRQENVKLFKENGKIVYLKASVNTLLKRVEGDTARPLLAGNTKERLTALYSARAEAYAVAADIIIDTDDLSPERIADKIQELIN